LENRCGKTAAFLEKGGSKNTYFLACCPEQKQGASGKVF